MKEVYYSEDQTKLTRVSEILAHHNITHTFGMNDEKARVSVMIHENDEEQARKLIDENDFFIDYSKQKRARNRSVLIMTVVLGLLFALFFLGDVLLW